MRPQRVGGAFVGVGQHAKHVSHPYRGDHHRQQEDDPKKAPSGQLLHDEQSQAQGKQELDADVDPDIDDGHHQSAGPAARQHRADHQPQQQAGHPSGEEPSHEADRRAIVAASVAIQRERKEPIPGGKDHESNWGQRAGEAKEVVVVDPRDELGVVVETDEL